MSQPSPYKDFVPRPQSEVSQENRLEQTLETDD